MCLTRLDLQIGWLLFLDYLKESWEKFIHIPEGSVGKASPLVPGYALGYYK